jgi:uncharacterized protein
VITLERREINDALITQIVDVIVERFNPQRIVLFGSRARNQARPDSDIDLFVEMDSILNPRARSSAIYAAFDDCDWPMDVLVYTPQEVNELRGVFGTMLSIIESTGKVLYAR